MQAYRVLSPVVTAAQQHLSVVSAWVTRDQETVDAIARRHGCSRAQVYKLARRATAALMPRRPGPLPGHTALTSAHARIADLEVQLARARAQLVALEQRSSACVELTARRAHALELVLAQENVSLRGMQRVFEVAFDGRGRASLPELHARLREQGKKARRLLDQARVQVRDRITCVMGDDVFFARTPVKVLAEPRSVAILNLGRWPWHAAEDWSLWLEEFGALNLFVSDLGSDLVGAADARGVPHAADFFHEMQWWEREVFGPLSSQEEKARAEAQRLLERMIERGPIDPREDLPRQRAAATRAATQAEEAFFAAYAAVERIRALFQPLRVDGTLWTDAVVSSELDAIDATLRSVTHKLGRRARKHVATHGHRFAMHRVALNAIPVEVRPGSSWTAQSAKQALLTTDALDRTAYDATRTMEERLTAQRRARQLERALRRHIVNVDAVRTALRRHVTYPPRSSSAIESLNSQLRVMQTVHRTVSDPMLALHALAWNLTPRTEGRRKGRSPYAMLGVDLGQGDRPWYDVLLDASAA